VSLTDQIAVFLRSYPQIYFACHRRHVRDETTQRTLTLKQASILDHLHTGEPTNLLSLARHMRVTPSTMSLNVDRLEHAGYVRRDRDRLDARRVELRLTRAGDRLKQQQKLLDPELVATLLNRLNGADRAIALQGLELLAQAAAEMVAARKLHHRPPSDSNSPPATTGAEKKIISPARSRSRRKTRTHHL